MSKISSTFAPAFEKSTRDVAQPGSATVWGTGGRKFKSCHPDITHFAEQYETADFLQGDPSWFMHQVKGAANQETMAFIASTLSYGNRKQFMPKIDFILKESDGEIYEWLRNGKYRSTFRPDDKRSFYRLYTYSAYCQFLDAYSSLLNEYGTLGKYVKRGAKTGYEAVEIICNYFSSHGVSVIIPKDTTSACKRVCMFLRWMVRDSSPVDLGLWQFIDKKTLIIPLDTHVMQQANALKLINSKCASMSTAIRLTDSLRTIFPDDPVRGDFALFGYGIDHK